MERRNWRRSCQYKAGAHQFPLLVPIAPDAPAVPALRKARAALKGWSKPALVLFSDKDPITAGGDKWFRELMPTAAKEPEIVIKGAGHFLQEDKGEEIAEHIRRFFGAAGGAVSTKMPAGQMPLRTWKNLCPSGTALSEL